MVWEKRKKRLWLFVTSMLCLLLVLIIIFSAMGSADISFGTSMRILAGQLPVLSSFIDLEGISAVQQKIVLNIRLPRILLAAFVGMLLSGSGVVYQAIFKNPMADPYVLGVSSGAALGATIGILISVSFSAFGLSGVSLLAFAGALGTTFFVYGVSRVGHKAPVVTLLLSGIAISFFFHSLISMIMTLNRDHVESIVFWTFGSVATANWQKVLITLPIVLVSTVVFLLHGRTLNILSLGEEDARSLGVHVERTKMVLLVVTALATASAVAVSGIIGFVGLVIPQVVRLVVGPDVRVLIPSALLGGAVFLVICDALSRLVLMPTEIPIGVITALVGAPYFLSLVVSNKNKVMKG